MSLSGSGGGLLLIVSENQEHLARRTPEKCLDTHKRLDFFYESALRLANSTITTTRKLI